jgi:hypothetical protein
MREEVKTELQVAETLATVSTTTRQQSEEGCERLSLDLDEDVVDINEDVDHQLGSDQTYNALR